MPVSCSATRSLGTKMEYIESVQASDFESTFRNYASRGYDFIMAAGTQFDDAANKVAPSFPKTTFCVVNGMVSKSANVAPIFPKEYEASYIAGLIAGSVSPKGQFADYRRFPQQGHGGPPRRVRGHRYERRLFARDQRRQGRARLRQ